MLACDRFAPTSKRHLECGYVYRELKLSDREWTCSGCRARVLRDLNAARNVRYYALKRYFSTYSGVERTGVSVELSGKGGSDEAERFRERAMPTAGSHLL